MTDLLGIHAGSEQFVQFFNGTNSRDTGQRCEKFRGKTDPVIDEYVLVCPEMNRHRIGQGPVEVKNQRSRIGMFINYFQSG